MAQEILINGRTVRAQEALDLGMVTQLVEDVGLLQAGLMQARKLAAGPVAAIGGVRKLLLESYGDTFESQLERELEQICAAGGGAEGREGVDAFIAKRTPDFKGCK